jgi:hypothetical protein
MSNELDKFTRLYHLPNKGGHNRCSICNATSNEEIETDIGDYKAHMSFTPDPKDPMHFICIDCSEVINEQEQDYAYRDLEEKE